ncbi:BamA/TamA family outer membrane protein [Pontibacter ruber]|uniref:BamA/TamA family outer membrane protein n=1 Tax=Pontibacter ruber TaxID=1343895 RepID=A0ABW5D0P1_9BACT|nr:BamA/TamA family outer membrane protein [Pontibacter ruber]
MVKYLAAALLLACLLPGTGLKTYAQDQEPISAQSDLDRKTVKGFIPIPVLYYTPDTRLGFGAAVLGYFKLPSKVDTSYTRLSTVRLIVDYTLNKQTDQLLDWVIFTRDEGYLLRGELRHRIYTDRFYGIGNNTSTDDEGRYAYDYVSARFAGLKKIGARTFVGPDLQVTNYYDLELDSLDENRESLLQAQRIPGYQGGLNSGLGLVFLVDSRDNVAFASSGIYLEVSGYHFGRTFGGDFNYNNFNLDFRKYFELKPNKVLAFNTSFNLNNGEIPVMRMAPAGGDRILRGYAKNRFLEDNFAGAQLEYRFPLFWRLGMAAFAGAGDVFEKPSDVTFSTLKYSVGSGLRYALNPQQKLNIRADVGYGREGVNFYIVIGEAF